MNTELKHLISLVKNSNEPVHKVVREYFAETVWSVLKQEFCMMSSKEKAAFYNRLEGERK